MYGDKVLNAPMLKSTAISDAGLTKQTLYEVERSAFTRTTYDRAIEEALMRSTTRLPSSFRRLGGADDRQQEEAHVHAG